jgi:NDP-sugar pyrophosphorylase family protein
LFSFEIDMQCIVLAGGLGRRMLPRTERLPKSLLLVGGRPFVDWQLAWLAAERVEHVVMSIGYRGDMIRRHLGNSRFGLRISYVDDGDVPLGTGGALRLVVDQKLADPHFFVLYGDAYLPISLSDIEACYSMHAAPVLMTVYRDRESLERPNVVFDGSMVTRYEKGLENPPAEMNYVDYGISVWQREIVHAMVPKGAAADLADVFAVLSGSGQLAGFEARERFYEIGSPRGLRDLESRLRSGGILGNPPDIGR